MPNYYSRLNLASAIFPFYTEAAGRTIMLPQYDENWDRYNAANTVQDKGVPQVFYMHNVMPIAGGFQSIAYIKQLSGLLNVSNMDTAFNLFNSSGSNIIFVPAAGTNYIYNGSFSGWQSFPFAAGLVSSRTIVSTAYVQGKTYICYAGLGVYLYDDVANTFTQQTLVGLTATSLVGICSANGYMIAATNNAVAWSSLTNPLNFIPSIQTGAGGGNVGSAKGNINFILAVSGGGFLLYCEQNIVGAQFTGNTAFPYIILEVSGSGGVDTPDKVAYQSTLPYHIAMTTGGIQQINIVNATPTLPEVSDFLTSQLFEDFNETTLSFSTTYLGSQVYIKFAAVSARFILLSYGPTANYFTHIIVYDIALNRYGKLKINHSSTFTYNDPTPFGLITYSELLNTPIGSLTNTTYGDFFDELQENVQPKKNVAILGTDGTVSTVDFELSETSADGVFIIGKFQLQRSAVIIHQYSDIETVNTGTVFSMYLLPTFDGKDFTAAIPTITNRTAQLTRRFAKRYTAQNLSLCLVGAFNLNSIILNFTTGGFR